MNKKTPSTLKVIWHLAKKKKNQKQRQIVFKSIKEIFILNLLPIIKLNRLYIERDKCYKINFLVQIVYKEKLKRKNLNC